MFIISNNPESSRAMLEECLSGVVVLGIDEEICRRFGQIRGSLRRYGTIVGDFDLLIASSALSHNLILLTNNRRHFESIEGLRMESISG